LVPSCLVRRLSCPLPRLTGIGAAAKGRADDDQASSPGAGAKGVFGLSVDFLRRHLLDGESSGPPDG